MRNFVTFTLAKRNQKDKVKDDQMSIECSENGDEGECIQDIGGKSRENYTTGNTKFRWANNFKKDFRARIKWYGLD